MPSHGNRNKRQRDESHTPERPPMDELVYWIWETLKDTAKRVANIENEVRATNRATTGKSLQKISNRLSKLESDINRFDCPHQDMMETFERFRQQLASIQEEVAGSNSQPGHVPGSDGTLLAYLKDLGTQMSGITDRMGNVEDSLLKLEDRLFGRFDESVNNEAGYVMIKLPDESEYRQKLKKYSMIDLTQMVQAQGGPWSKVDTVKLQDSREKGKFNHMIISFSDWETAEHIRKYFANLNDLFELEHSCSCLPFIHHLHIADLAAHQKMGYDYNMQKFLDEELREPGVKAKVAFQRVILQTPSFDTARRLVLTGVMVYSHNYKVV
jgi:hypothetical protein